MGATIKLLWLLDAQHHLYQAQGVVAGARVPLATLNGPGNLGTQPGPRALLQAITFVAHGDNLDASVWPYLQAGSYIAVLDSNPFVENGLGKSASSDHTVSSSIVYGILDNPATP